jgi:hypothetical protein
MLSGIHPRWRGEQSACWGAPGCRAVLLGLVYKAQSTRDARVRNVPSVASSLRSDSSSRGSGWADLRATRRVEHNRRSSAMPNIYRTQRNPESRTALSRSSAATVKTVQLLNRMRMQPRRAGLGGPALQLSNGRLGRRIAVTLGGGGGYAGGILLGINGLVWTTVRRRAPPIRTRSASKRPWMLEKRRSLALRVPPRVPPGGRGGGAGVRSPR